MSRRGRGAGATRTVRPLAAAALAALLAGVPAGGPAAAMDTAPGVSGVGDGGVGAAPPGTSVGGPGAPVPRPTSEAD